MNKDPESWSRVSVDAVCVGSPAQVRNVLAMALDDIQTLAMQVDYWRQLYASVFNCDAKTKNHYRERARQLERGVKED